MLGSTFKGGIILATLNDKNVGDVVKIKENGTAVNYIIVHKGIPGSLYDSSCDGVWVLRQTAYQNRTWNGTTGSGSNNDYENSDINKWLNNTFLSRIDEKIRANIKTAIIPFKKGNGDDPSGVYSGTDGLSCKVFLLSGYEVGFTTSTDEYFPVDGAKLAYFSDNASRIAKNSSGTSADWWLRSPYAYSFAAWHVTTIGANNFHNTNVTSVSVRPAFVLPFSLLVNSDNTVTTNNDPIIVSDKTGNLGTLTNGFACNYSVNDADAADSLTVTLTLDGVQKSKFAAAKGAQYTYVLTGNDWLKITNGTHTFKITASDGKDTVESTATFTRSQTEAAVMPDTPMDADDIIRACSLKVEGSFPADAVHKYEVTNNALDDEPVWEDCTERVRAGLNYMFKNNTAENGFAFNFRVSVRRGASNAGGYIARISGGFE